MLKDVSLLHSVIKMLTAVITTHDQQSHLHLVSSSALRWIWCILWTFFHCLLRIVFAVSVRVKGFLVIALLTDR